MREEEIKKLRHVVLFKFKDSSEPAIIESLHQQFIHLAAVIPEIEAFEWGLNHSPEDLHQGLTHCYMLTFLSEDDRDNKYTPHPQHQNFVKQLKPHLDKVLVVDYWAHS